MARDPTLLMLLQKARGDMQKTEDLVPYLSAELRRLAQSLISHTAPGRTLTPTALVHEAYLRLVDPEVSGLTGRTEFYTAAARSMRDILVEQARRKASLKRGADRRRTDDVAELAIEPLEVDVLALDEALQILEAQEPRKARIVSLRYFTELSDDEIGEILNCPSRTIQREWRFVHAWLLTRLDPGAPSPE